MRLIPRIPLVALVAALVLSLASPASATTATKERQRRDAARAKRAQLAGRIDALKASDAELDRAVQAMDTQVRGEQARSDAAHQALQAAKAQESAANARLAETQAKVAAMRQQVMGRAIESYIHPSESKSSPIITETDLGEMSRRAALMNEVAGRDRETLDQLNATKGDLADDQQNAARARQLAEARRQLEDQTLSELRRAQADKERLQGALQARIKEYQDEADAVGAEETALSNLIRSKELPPPASRAVGSASNGRVSSAGLIWPVSGPVTSGFGYRWGRLHAGIDISCGIGTPVHAAKAGTVIFSGQMSGYGNVEVVDHGGGFSTLYAHLSRLGASEGTQVGQGQVIAYSGNTGHSTGPHLHFETRVGGNPQNPRQYLP